MFINYAQSSLGAGRPVCLTIAGFDPTGGAGLTADIRVLERFGLASASVCTAVTAQNDQEFVHPGWVPSAQILLQLDTLLRQCRPGFIKIGLVQDPQTLKAILQYLRLQVPGALVLWDPILKASAGFSFHDSNACREFFACLSLVDLVTPNLPEARALAAVAGCIQDSHLAACLAKQGPAVLLKGGHGQGEQSEDYIQASPNHRWASTSFVRPRLAGVDRHGSGCTLSAALLAHLALGHSIPVATEKAGAYVHQWLQRAELPAWRSPVSRLHVLTLDGLQRSHGEQVSELLRAGCDWIQLRCKQPDAQEFLQQHGPDLVRQARAHGATMVVNDHHALANRIAAHGAHLGLGDGAIAEVRPHAPAGFLLGGTANTEAQVEMHLRAGADYVGLGPFRFTGSKKNLSPLLGLDGVRRICQAFPGAPLLVIGGIEPADIPALLEAGAHGVAVSSGIVAAPDIVAAYQHYWAPIRSYIQHSHVAGN